MKANVQVILPFLTESYSSTNESLELSTPLDVIYNFPIRIEHTIQWAHQLFLELFVDLPEQAKEYIRDPKSFIKNHSEDYQNEMIEKINRFLGSSRPYTFFDCIKWVSHNYERLLLY
jgi:ubiquitin-activating enzyme E1